MDIFGPKFFEVWWKKHQKYFFKMCSPSVLECPRHTYGTLRCSCASLACPYARTRLPLLGWGGLRLSLAAHWQKIWKNTKNLEISWFFVFFSNVFPVCPGCSQHASGTPACLCALRFASTHALTYVTLIIIWSFPNNNYTKKYDFLTVSFCNPKVN